MEKFKLDINAKNLLTQYKTPILYTGGSIIKAFAQLIGSFIVARYISPNDLGLWSAINLALVYSGFLQAGLINGLNLELPYAYGRGEEEKAKNMAGTVQTYSVAISVLMLFIGFSYFFFGHVQNIKTRYGILAVILIIIVNYYQSYLTSTFRSKNSFKKLSIVQIVEATAILASLILIVKYSYYGMIARAVIVLIVSVMFLHFSRPIKVGLIWDKKAFIKLFKVGFPIFGLAYLQTVSATADKLWLLKYSDITDVGLYSFALYSISLFSVVSSSVATYIYPRMTYNFGKNNDKNILWKYVKKVTLILFLILAPLSILAYFLIPTITTAYFPKYILSISAMQILVFAGVFIGCVVGVNVLWSIKSWKHMILYMVTYSLLLIILPFVGIKLFDNKIVGVAYGVLAASFVSFISGYYLSYLGTRDKKPEFTSG